MATRPCPNSDPPPVSPIARSPLPTASLPAPHSPPSRRSLLSTRKSCVSTLPVPAISASVCLVLDMLLPLSNLQNHTQFCADLGEQVTHSCARKCFRNAFAYFFGRDS